MTLFLNQNYSKVEKYFFLDYVISCNKVNVAKLKLKSLINTMKSRKLSRLR